MLSLLSERFRSKIEVDESGCWLWTASLRGGYGQARVDGSVIGAHRAVWLELVGPIPEDLVLDHTCRVPRCVNPEHLRAVTQRENVHAPGSQCVAKKLAERTCCDRCGGPFTLVRGKRQCTTCAMSDAQRSRLATLAELDAALDDLELAAPDLTELVHRVRALILRGV